MEAGWQAALARAVLVGSGGFLGALLRHGVGVLVQRRFPTAGFPYGTLTVNLLGCLAIGVLAGLAESRQLVNLELRAFLVVGLLGGFTTFSAFGNETFALLRTGAHLQALANVALHVLLGLALVGVGYVLARAV